MWICRQFRRLSSVLTSKSDFLSSLRTGWSSYNSALDLCGSALQIWLRFWFTHLFNSVGAAAPTEASPILVRFLETSPAVKRGSEKGVPGETVHPLDCSWKICATPRVAPPQNLWTKYHKNPSIFCCSGRGRKIANSCFRCLEKDLGND